jgi:hypothetical protein
MDKLGHRISLLNLMLLLQFQHRKLLARLKRVLELIGSLVELLPDVMANRKDELTLAVPVVIVE